MSELKLKPELAEQNLRLASEYEAGYSYVYFDESGQRQSAWVTDAESGS